MLPRCNLAGSKVFPRRVKINQDRAKRLKIESNDIVFSYKLISNNNEFSCKFSYKFSYKFSSLAIEV